MRHLEQWLKDKPRDRFEFIDESTPKAARLVLLPMNPRACRLVIVSPNNSTQWHIGRALWFDEVDGLRGRGFRNITSELSSSELVSLLNCVWLGAIRETICESRGVIIASKGELTLDGTKFRVKRCRSLRLLFVRADRVEDVRYEAY